MGNRRLRDTLSHLLLEWATISTGPRFWQPRHLCICVAQTSPFPLINSLFDLVRSAVYSQCFTVCECVVKSLVRHLLTAHLASCIFDMTVKTHMHLQTWDTRGLLRVKLNCLFCIDLYNNHHKGEKSRLGLENMLCKSCNDLIVGLR